ncbi:hypothetical protein Tco_0944341 [Tanacetum coccineum]
MKVSISCMRSGSGGLSNDKHPIDADIVGDVKDILDGCHKLVETFRMARDRAATCLTDQLSADQQGRRTLEDNKPGVDDNINK